MLAWKQKQKHPFLQRIYARSTMEHILKQAIIGSSSCFGLKTHKENCRNIYKYQTLSAWCHTTNIIKSLNPFPD